MRDAIIALVTGEQLRQAIRDATLGQRSVLGAGGRARERCASRSRARTRLRSQRRNLAVGGIGDERSPVVPVAGHGPHRAVVPRVCIEIFRALFVRACARTVETGENRSEHLVAESGVAGAVEQLGRTAFHGLDFRVREAIPAFELFRALERRGVVVSPHAREIRLAVDGARQLPRRRVRGWRRLGQ